MCAFVSVRLWRSIQFKYTTKSVCQLLYRLLLRRTTFNMYETIIKIKQITFACQYLRLFFILFYYYYHIFLNNSWGIRFNIENICAKNFMRLYQKDFLLVDWTSTGLLTFILHNIFIVLRQFLQMLSSIFNVILI